MSTNLIECEYCGKEFKTKANLRRHIKNYCKEKKMDAERINKRQTN